MTNSPTHPSSRTFGMKASQPFTIRKGGIHTANIIPALVGCVKEENLRALVLDNSTFMQRNDPLQLTCDTGAYPETFRITNVLPMEGVVGLPCN